MNDLEALIKQLEIWDDAYLEGNPLVSDAEYDQLYRKVKATAPTHVYFQHKGSSVRGGKIKLPHPMSGLEQVYENEIVHWVKRNSHENTDFITSDKLDGTSSMLIFKRSRLGIAYSRGNDVEGADITRHVSKIPSVPKKLPKDIDLLVIRGEMIMKNSTFAAKYADKFANPRSMIAGCMNRSDTDQNILNDIDFIAYQVIECSENFKTKNETFDFLAKMGFMTAPRYSRISGSQLTDKLLSNLLATARAKSPYELDGIVLTDNDISSGETSFKYKVLRDDDIVEATVTQVLWEISKSGFWKPRVEIKPVSLFGTTVTYATGFNGKFIFDNGIGPGAKIKITKSGSVIPYILGVIHRVNPQMPKEWKWNDTKVEALVVNAESNEEVKFKLLLDFFNTLEVDQLKEATLRNIFDNFRLKDEPVKESIKTILSLMEAEWINMVGANGSKIYNSLARRANNLQLATFLGATPFFGIGFGVRRTKMLLEQVDRDSLSKLTVADVTNLDGFDLKTATQFIKGLPEALALLKELKDDGLVKIAAEEQKGDALKGVNAVFTGFRDKALEEKIEKAGGKIGSSVSSKTTHLLALDPNSGSSKFKKASELRVEIMTPDEFKDRFNL